MFDIWLMLGCGVVGYVFKKITILWRPTKTQGLALHHLAFGCTSSVCSPNSGGCAAILLGRSAWVCSAKLAGLGSFCQNLDKPTGHCKSVRDSRIENRNTQFAALHYDVVEEPSECVGQKVASPGNRLHEH